MRRLDRLARQQRRDAQAAADRAEAHEAEERERVEREIHALIPSVLTRLERMDPELSGMQNLTYDVARLPLLGDRFGWRAVTRAAWELGEWTLPTSASSRATPVWLLSNGLIGWNGLDGEPMVDAVDSIGERWPSMLPVILVGLHKR
jgi:hypothetical protein